MVEEKIQANLDEIEAEFGVTVIFACESGSRAWGFPSADSDYDVRMVYHHPVDWYLSLRDKRDVIERPIEEKLDINGWDIAKTLKLLAKSNPNILEWANSPIVYRETEEFGKVRSLLEVAFNPQSSFLHYLSMARGNYQAYLSRSEINVKKYLYTLRPLMCALWIDTKQSQPPMLYRELVEGIVGESEVAAEIENLVRVKRTLSESDIISSNAVLDKWITDTFALLEGKKPQDYQTPDWDIFDAAFRDIIGFE